MQLKRKGVQPKIRQIAEKMGVQPSTVSRWFPKGDFLEQVEVFEKQFVKIGADPSEPQWAQCCAQMFVRNTAWSNTFAATCRGIPADSNGSKMYPTEQQKRPMIRTPAAATYCGSSTSTFEKRRLEGGGHRYLRLGRRVAYDPADLDTWLATKRRSST
jgi:predicted DNA-binding transcriptional regulator AlpA